jgi:hypothetical protein
MSFRLCLTSHAGASKPGRNMQTAKATGLLLLGLGGLLSLPPIASDRATSG